MKKRRSERKPVESGTVRYTRNRTRQQQDEVLHAYTVLIMQSPEGILVMDRDFEPKLVVNGSFQSKRQEPAKSRDDPLLLLKEYPFGSSCPEVRRNPGIQSREMDPSLEETLLAFSDAHGGRDLEDIEEDKLTFLEATYARCGVRADASIPTQKIFEEIFRIVQESQSGELTSLSFLLLKDLEKRHPRVAIATEEADRSSGQSIQRIDIDRRVWSPIESLIEEFASTDRMVPVISAEESIPLNLLTLVDTIAGTIYKEESQPANCASRAALNSQDGVKMAGQFLMLQHLVGLIQNDLSCCLQVYEESMDQVAVKKSSLYRLLCVLPADARNNFLSNLVFLVKPNGQHIQTDEEVLNDKEGDHCLTSERESEASNKRGLLPSGSDFSHLAHRLLLMIMEIDHATKTWNPVSARSMRRGSFPDDLLSIFSIARHLEAYLEALDSPRTKLRFIVDYFIANAPVEMVVKGLKDSTGRETFEKLLACFGEDKAKKFVHKFGEDVLPVVLAHAFQAFLIIHIEAATDDHENERQAKLLQMSRSLVEILTELRELERQTEMLPVAEQVIQMAESILVSS